MTFMFPLEIKAERTAEASSRLAAACVHFTENVKSPWDGQKCLQASCSAPAVSRFTAHISNLHFVFMTKCFQKFLQVYFQSSLYVHVYIWFYVYDSFFLSAVWICLLHVVMVFVVKGTVQTLTSVLLLISDQIYTFIKMKSSLQKLLNDWSFVHELFL